MAGRHRPDHGALGKPLPVQLAAILAPYIEAVQVLNEPGPIATYPGSPLVARLLMRSEDRLVVNELHPEDRALLEAELGRDKAVTILGLDAWIAVKAIACRRRSGAASC